jgi:hypothetical protein
MAAIGTLIAESLRPGALIELGLTLRRLQRVTISDAAAGQPPVWTLIDFTCPDDLAGGFAEQLAAAMDTGPWYADYGTDETKYVVFAGRVFAFARGDRAANQEAIAYARTVGVPEAQLDWKF